MTDYPFVPSKELIKEWRNEIYLIPSHLEIVNAANWGADQELEACVKLLSDLGGDGEMIRRYRRPAEKTAKDKALKALVYLRKGISTPGDLSTIQNALEQLND